MANVMRVVTEEEFKRINKDKQLRSGGSEQISLTVLGSIKEKIDSVLHHSGLKEVPQLWRAWKMMEPILQNETLSWNKNGAISYNGVTIINSNIVDLVKYAAICSMDLWKQPGQEIFTSEVRRLAKTLDKKILKFLKNTD